MKTPSEATNRTSRGTVVERGLATWGEDGRLHVTEEAFPVIQKLQAEHRKRLLLDKDRTVRVKVGWSGALLAELSEICAERVLVGASLRSTEAVEAIWRALLGRGFSLVHSQVRYGLAIVKNATSPDEVWRLAGEHRSYGDWWTKLSPAERSEVTKKRHRAQFQFLKSLTPDEVADRSKKVFANAARAGAGKENTETQRVGEQIEKARLLDKALKSLEEGYPSNSKKLYPGLQDPMRSSWEAQYARAVLNHPDRFFFYEPIGFTLINPENGRFEVYHPDFIVCRNTRGQGMRHSIVEIKGYLTETGRRKIRNFRDYYIRGDFSSVPESRRDTLARIVARTKEDVQRQFGLKVGPDTAFKVYGDLPWSWNHFNFDQSILNGRGFMPRLRAKFPQFGADGPPKLSNTERKQLTKQATNGADDGRLIAPVPPKTEVAPAKPQQFRIQRSTEYIIDTHAAGTVYTHLCGLNRQIAIIGAELKISKEALSFVTAATAQAANAALSWHIMPKEHRALSREIVVSDSANLIKATREWDSKRALEAAVVMQSAPTILGILAIAPQIWKLISEDGRSTVREGLKIISESAEELRKMLLADQGRLHDRIPKQFEGDALLGMREVAQASSFHLELLKRASLQQIEAAYGIDFLFILRQLAQEFHHIGAIRGTPDSAPLFDISDPSFQMPRGDSAFGKRLVKALKGTKYEIRQLAW